MATSLSDDAWRRKAEGRQATWEPQVPSATRRRAFPEPRMVSAPHSSALAAETLRQPPSCVQRQAPLPAGPGFSRASGQRVPSPRAPLSATRRVLPRRWRQSEGRNRLDPTRPARHTRYHTARLSSIRRAEKTAPLSQQSPLTDSNRRPLLTIGETACARGMRSPDASRRVESMSHGRGDVLRSLERARSRRAMRGTRARPDTRRRSDRPEQER